MATGLLFSVKTKLLGSEKKSLSHGSNSPFSYNFARYTSGETSKLSSVVATQTAQQNLDPVKKKVLQNRVNEKISFVPYGKHCYKGNKELETDRIYFVTKKIHSRETNRKTLVHKMFIRSPTGDFSG